MLVLLASATLLALEPTPTDPLTIAAGGTVIGLVAALALALIRTSNRRGEGWADVMKAWQDASTAATARAETAEHALGEMRAEANQAWEAARFAEHERATWEQRFLDCERERAAGR